MNQNGFGYAPRVEEQNMERTYRVMFIRSYQNIERGSICFLNMQLAMSLVDEGVCVYYIC